MQDTTAPRLSLEDLHTVDELAARYPNVLTSYTLRWQLRDREKNGLAGACVRIGKKLLISKTRYEQWLAAKTEKAA